MLSCSARSILLPVVTVYMPVDYEDRQSLDDFRATLLQLGYLEGILASIQFDCCICFSNFNVDLEKERPLRFCM